MISEICISDVTTPTVKLFYQYSVWRAVPYDHTGEGRVEDGVGWCKTTVTTTEYMGEKDKTSSNHDCDTAPCIKGKYGGQRSVKKEASGTETKNTHYRRSVGGYFGVLTPLVFGQGLDHQHRAVGLRNLHTTLPGHLRDRDVYRDLQLDTWWMPMRTPLDLYMATLTVTPASRTSPISTSVKDAVGPSGS